MLTLALALLAADPAQSTPTFVILGAGNRTCASWVDGRNRPADRSYMSSWVVGYLTAANEFTPEGRVGRNLDPRDWQAWLDNYCGAHPLDTLHHAVGLLRGEMIIRDQ